jgi:hypothetical protein
MNFLNHPTRDWYYLDGESGYMLDISSEKPSELMKNAYRTADQLVTQIVKEAIEFYKQQTCFSQKV